MREIERRFIVNPHKLPSTQQLTILKPLTISQGYIYETDPLVRVCLVNILTEPKAYITFKGPGLLSRVEIEDEILPGKALEIFKFAKYTLAKHGMPQ